MPQQLSPTKPARQAVEQGKPLAVFMPWPAQVPYRILTCGKPFRSKPGRRTRTLVKHERLHRLKARVRAIQEIGPWWGRPREEFAACGYVILDPHNLPAPHPEMAGYNWWGSHGFHDHETYGAYTTRGAVPGVNAPRE
jgi:hypothetical protein